MDYKWIPLYYNGLVKVKYYDSKTKKMRRGFCYFNRLVDYVSGEEFGIEDVVRCGVEQGVPQDDVIIELDWQMGQVGRSNVDDDVESGAW